MKKFLSAVLATAALAFALAAPAQNLPPLATFAPAGSFRNVLVCGDFGACPWQRGTPSGTINTTATYWADNWFSFANNAGAATTVSKQTVAVANLLGFSQAAQVQRTAANANTQQICFGQIVETANVPMLAGQTVGLSFNALAGSTFSAASSNLQVNVITGTGTDQGAASLLAGTWTGQANALTNVATPILTTWGRYALTVTLPSAATEVAVTICDTPVGTAGANDFFQVTGVQLEALPVGTASGLTGSAALAVVSPFERRSATVERILAQRYLYVLNEPAGTITAQALCQATTTTVAKCFIPFPVQMRAIPAAPTVTTGTYAATVAAGTSQAGTLTNTGTVGVQGATITFTAGAANLVAGIVSQLIGTAGTGSIVFTAEP